MNMLGPLTLEVGAGIAFLRRHYPHWKPLDCKYPQVIFYLYKMAHPMLEIFHSGLTDPKLLSL